MKHLFFCLFLMLAAASALAQTGVTLGQPAPAEVAAQLKNAPVTQIGTESVRPLPSAQQERAKAAAGASLAKRRTLVARSGDNLVGVSHHELVVMDADLEAVAARVDAMNLAGATTRAYPRLGLLIVSTARFEQLAQVRDQLTTAFPRAKFDLPVTYFPKRLR